MNMDNNIEKRRKLEGALLMNKEMLQRLERLEIDNEVTQHNFTLIQEMLSIMKDLPLGNLIIRRAENKRALSTLKQIILPRRQRQLLEIINMEEVPSQIRQPLVDDEMKLIKSATNAIRHRECYENKIKNVFAKNIDTIRKFKSPNRRIQHA
jgi:hypothetical protein